MKLYIIEDYKNEYPELSGRELTSALVRDILTGEGYAGETDQVIIDRLEGGKPVFSGPLSHIALSVSHTGNIFGCALAEGEKSIGLDLQKSKSTDAERLARRYYTEEEQRMVLASGDRPAPDPAAFFRVWTRKEAFGKYTGGGLAVLLERQPVYGRDDVSFIDLDFGDGLYGCICTAAK